jgi:hypothetical protein
MPGLKSDSVIESLLQPALFVISGGFAVEQLICSTPFQIIFIAKTRDWQGI